MFGELYAASFWKGLLGSFLCVVHTWCPYYDNFALWYESKPHTKSTLDENIFWPLDNTSQETWQQTDRKATLHTTWSQWTGNVCCYLFRHLLILELLKISTLFIWFTFCTEYLHFFFCSLLTLRLLLLNSDLQDWGIFEYFSTTSSLKLLQRPWLSLPDDPNCVTSPVPRKNCKVGFKKNAKKIKLKFRIKMNLKNIFSILDISSSSKSNLLPTFVLRKSTKNRYARV